MRRTTYMITSLAGLALVLAGCQVGNGDTTAEATQSATVVAASAQSQSASSSDDDATVAAEAGDTVNPPTAEQAMAANANASKVKDDEWDASTAQDLPATTSTTTITAAGVYRLSGAYGQVVVAAPDDALVVLILDGATITNASGPAIQIDSADDVAISLTGSNSVSDASSYADTAEANAAIYSAADLTITGSGSLAVSGNGKDGITSKDDLYVLSGTLDVTAKDHGLKGKDSLTIAGGSVTVDAGGDGLKSDKSDDATKGYVRITGGTVDVTAGQDGIDATTDAILTGGTLDVKSGGGADAGKGTTSGKGVKAGTFLIVDGATVSVDAGDDAVHSDGAVRLSSGTLTLASGDDGVHAEVAAVLDGADVTVSRSYEGIEGGLVTVSDGNVDVTASDDGVNASGSTTVEEGVAAAAASATDEASGTITEEGPGGPMGGGGGGSEDDTGEQLTIAGGNLKVVAGSDALDSNGSITVTGGSTVLSNPASGIEGLFANNGTLRFDGGTVLATGSTGQGLSPSTDSAQGWVTVSTSGTAGTALTVADSSGTEIGSGTALGDYSVAFFTSPDVRNGETYTIGEASAEAGTSTGGGMGGGPGSGMGGGPGGR